MPGPYSVVPPSDSDFWYLSSVAEQANALYVLIGTPKAPSPLIRAIAGIYHSQSRAFRAARTALDTQWNIPSFRVYMVTESGDYYVNGNGTVPK